MRTKVRNALMSVSNSHLRLPMRILYLLWVLSSPCAGLKCYECAYRQHGGDKALNHACLHPKNSSLVQTVSCAGARKYCIKSQAQNDRYGIVMERGCFPKFSPICKRFQSLGNQDHTSLFFGATLSAVAVADDDEADDGGIIFHNVKACVCHRNGCNDGPGWHVNVPNATKGRSAGGARKTGEEDANDSTKTSSGTKSTASGSGQSQVPEDKATSAFGVLEPIKGQEKEEDKKAAGLRLCYGCYLGVECNRLHALEKMTCRDFGACYTATVIIGDVDFTERGCGACADGPSGGVEMIGENCMDCSDNFCNKASAPGHSLWGFVPVILISKMYLQFF